MISSHLTRVSLIAEQLLGGRPWARILGLRGVPRFLDSATNYKRLAAGTSFPLMWRNLFPILHDAGDPAGATEGHYFHQDLWAARKIYQRRPSLHIDVGSRIDGFVGHLLSFMPVTVLDIRPLESKVEGLQFVQGDATNLHQFADNSVDSASSLHAVEHFGLGRYGDGIDPGACFSAMRALARVLAPAGRLYFSVPIGRERVEFNAHRVFSPRTVLREFHSLSLVSFAAVDDAGHFHATAAPDSFATADYSCGLFEFTK